MQNQTQNQRTANDNRSQEHIEYLNHLSLNQIGLDALRQDAPIRPVSS